MARIIRVLVAANCRAAQRRRHARGVLPVLRAADAEPTVETPSTPFHGALGLGLGFPIGSGNSSSYGTRDALPLRRRAAGGENSVRVVVVSSRAELPRNPNDHSRPSPRRHALWGASVTVPPFDVVRRASRGCGRTRARLAVAPWCFCLGSQGSMASARCTRTRLGLGLNHRSG